MEFELIVCWGGGLGEWPWEYDWTGAIECGRAFVTFAEEDNDDRVAVDSRGENRVEFCGACLNRTTISGFRDLRSGSGAQVSVGKWSDGSITRPSLPIIGPRSRNFSTSRCRAASIAPSGVPYGGAGC